METNKQAIVVMILLVIVGMGFAAFLLNTIPKDDASGSTVKSGEVQVEKKEEPITRETCLADSYLFIDNLEYPVSELSNEVVVALGRALDDEYKARATYEAVIEKHGAIRPFIMIIGAEENHIASLKSVFDKYGVEIPTDPYTGTLTSPDTVEEACAIGVQAEIENAALYRDELLPAVSEYEDIIGVFTNLMDASQLRHLPAFERCGGGGGMGRGMNR